MYSNGSYLCVVDFSLGSYNINIWPVAQSVLIFLGVPLVAAVITRFLLSLNGTIKRQNYAGVKMINWVN